MIIIEHWKGANPVFKYPLLALAILGFVFGLQVAAFFFWVLGGLIFMMTVIGWGVEGFMHSEEISPVGYFNKFNRQPIDIEETRYGYFRLEQRNGLFGLRLPLGDFGPYQFQSIEDAETRARRILDETINPIAEFAKFFARNARRVVGTILDNRGRKVVKRIK